MARSFYGSAFHGSDFHSSGYYRPTDATVPPIFPPGGPGGPDVGEGYTPETGYRIREEEEFIALITIMIESGMFDE